MHLKSLNVRHFVMIAATALETMALLETMTFNGNVSILNFIKIYQLVQKLIGSLMMVV
jgi:hypothetical protein